MVILVCTFLEFNIRRSLEQPFWTAGQIDMKKAVLNSGDIIHSFIHSSLVCFFFGSPTSRNRTRIMDMGYLSLPSFRNNRRSRLLKFNMFRYRSDRDIYKHILILLSMITTRTPSSIDWGVVVLVTQWMHMQKKKYTAQSVWQPFGKEKRG